MNHQEKTINDHVQSFQISTYSGPGNEFDRPMVIHIQTDRVEMQKPKSHWQRTIIVRPTSPQIHFTHTLTLTSNI